MNNITLTAEVLRSERVTADVDARHDVALWREAVSALREREVDGVRVRVDWTPMLRGDSVVQLALDVSRDAPGVVERYFHDVFLLANVAVPGAFGGVVTTTGSEYRVDELTFDASLFEYGWVKGGRAIGALPLADVVAWYDAHGFGTRDVAESPIEKALFHLLQVARNGGDEWTTRLRLSHCLDALAIGDDDVRQALDLVEAPVLHPLHDVDEPAAVDAIDRAAALVLAAVQTEIKAPPTPAPRAAAPTPRRPS